MSVEYTRFREPSERELALLVHLAMQIPDLKPGWEEGLLVSDMNDGGMGSLRLCFPGGSRQNRRYGRTVAEYEFSDVDGVLVLVALNVDQDGQLFELDVWKVDFSPLVTLPDVAAWR